MERSTSASVKNAPDPEELNAWTDEATRLGRHLASSRALPAEHKRPSQLNLINRLGRQDMWGMDLPDFFDLAIMPCSRNSYGRLKRRPSRG